MASLKVYYAILRIDYIHNFIMITFRFTTDYIHDFVVIKSGHPPYSAELFNRTYREKINSVRDGSIRPDSKEDRFF